MNKPTFYEQLGIVIPGATFLFGLLLLIPAWRELLAKDGVSIGQLGIFVLLSYAAGQLIAAVGNVGENLLWRVAGGMPSDWVIKSETRLISPQQRELLEEKVRSRLRITIETVRGLERKVWWPISRQLYADVAQYGRPDRIDTFNGNYGLNRGLAAACLVLGGIAATQSNWGLVAVLLALAGVYGYRAYRFGVHYARELYIQFLTIEEVTVSSSPRGKLQSKKAAEAS